MCHVSDTDGAGIATENNTPHCTAPVPHLMTRQVIVAILKASLRHISYVGRGPSCMQQKKVELGVAFVDASHLIYASHSCHWNKINVSFQQNRMGHRTKHSELASSAATATMTKVCCYLLLLHPCDTPTTAININSCCFRCSY